MLDLETIDELIQSYFDKVYQRVKLKGNNEDIIKEIVNKIVEGNNIKGETNFNLSQIHFINNHVKNTSTYHQKSIKNRSKINPKSIKNQLKIDFGSV